MLVKLNNDEAPVDFRPWRGGTVFGGAYALDTETTLIDDERPWLAPAYVIGAATDGRSGVFVTRDRVGAFLDTHAGVPVAFHNAPFDLDVLDAVAPEAAVYDRVDRDEVHDTQLMHRLYCLGSAGHAASGKGESTLEHCAGLYLGVTLPKDAKDSSGRDIRLSYGRWMNRPPGEIEHAYLDYLAKDALATFGVYSALSSLLGRLLQDSEDVWGFASPGWLDDQVRRWGWQTHHIQLKAAVVLRKITANGLTLDPDAHGRLAGRLGAKLESLRAELARHGYLPGQPGSGKALQAILRRLEQSGGVAALPRTPSGLYATSRGDLAEHALRVPFLATLAEYADAQKLQASFVGKMRRPALHPSFNPLARSGRTASFGELNAQNLPRGDGVRECVVPSAGHVFLKADYATIELATLGQALVSQFGLDSKMAAAINAGKDLHRLVAARVTGKPESEITDDERNRAKPINFGKPGAMGDAALKSYAEASYGVAMSDAEVAALSRAWMDLFPEMAEFLRDDSDPGAAAARFFALTPASHHESTGSRRFLDHPANAGAAGRPHPILGAMLLKTLAEPVPAKRTGEPYHPADLEYFWAQAQSRLDAFPTGARGWVSGRRASRELRRAALALVGRAPVFTLTGRLRAGATFAARRNTVFQGLAADGAKLALWGLWRAGYRLVNFVHDEVLVEVPAGGDLRAQAEGVRRLMVQGMRAVVPGVRVEVEYAACDRWYKKAKPVTAPDGVGLGLWHPPAGGGGAA